MTLKEIVDIIIIPVVFFVGLYHFKRFYVSLDESFKEIEKRLEELENRDKTL